MIPRPILDLLFPPIAAGFSVLIYVVFFWGVFQSLGRLAQVRRERARLRVVRRALAAGRAGGAVESLEELRARAGLRPREGESLAEFSQRTGLRAGLGAPGLDPGPEPATGIGKRIHALWALRATGRGGIEAMNAVYETRDSLNLETPRYLASILVLLGLAGTIWGLRGIITQLNVILSGAPGDTMTALMRAFEPMRAAFACTLAGIVTSILLAFLLTRADAAQSELLAEMEETVTLDLLPLVFPASEAAQLSQMGEVLTQSREYLHNFGDTLNDSRDFFAETLGAALRTAAHELQSSLSDATGALKASLEDMRGAAGALNESAQSVLHYRSELEAERQKVQDYLKESANRLVTLGTAVLQPLQAAADGIEKNRAFLEALAADNRLDRESLRQDTAAVVGGLGNVVGAITEDKEVLAGMAAGMQAALSEHTAGSERVGATLNNLVRQVRPELLEMPNGTLLGSALGETARGLEAVSLQTASVARELEADRGHSVEMGARVDRLCAAVIALTTAAPPSAIGELQAALRAMQQQHQQDQQQLMQVNQQQLQAATGLMQATLAEMRQIRAHMQEPFWKHMVGQRNGKLP